MQAGFSLVGIILFLAAGFALPCLSLPLTLSPASLPVDKTISEGFGDQVNSSLVAEEEMKEEIIGEEITAIEVAA